GRAAAPIDGVTLKLGRSGESGTLPLRQIEPGRYFGTGRLDSAGRITITAVIRRAGDRLTVTMPLHVSPKAVPHTVAPQKHRLAPYVNAVAPCVLLLGLSVRVARIVAPRPRRQPDMGPPAPAEMIPEDVR